MMLINEEDNNSIIKNRYRPEIDKFIKAITNK